MNKHIYHIEEQLLLNPLILKQRPRETSLKWDGSVAVIAGCTNETNFISTKSYYNKTPITYSSEEQISEIVIDGLRDKMMAIWDKVTRATIKEGTVWQGDLLFYEPPKFDFDDNTHKFKANIVNYSSLYKICNDVGIAWHTSIADSNPIHIEGVWEPQSVLPVSLEFPEVRDLEAIPSDILEYVIQYFNWCVVMVYPMYLDQHQVDEFIDTKMNRHLATLKTETGKVKAAAKWNGIRKMIHDLDYISINGELERVYEWKERVLKEQHQNVIDHIGVNGSIAGQDAHEGFVIKTELGHLIKLVDRKLFSFNNFEAHK